jgi:phosphatidylserine/phosphatidylglycerophosphate/cardiolipin synthase-like enzyme
MVSASQAVSLASLHTDVLLSPHRRTATGVPQEDSVEVEVAISRIRNGQQSPHKVLVLDGAAVLELKGETSFRVECNGWSGVLGSNDVQDVAKWITAITHWTLQGKKNRYSSFCPPRTNVNAKWYIDGEPTYTAMADAMESAKRCIFLADWYLSAVDAKYLTCKLGLW